MTERRLISVRSSGSISIIHSQTDGLVVAVHRIGHRGHRIWMRYITMCEAAWKLWCKPTRWRREKNYSSEFSALQEPRKVTSSLAIRDRKCTLADGGHFEKLVGVLNGESVTVHLTTYLKNAQCSSFLSNLLNCTLKSHNSWTYANRTHVFMAFLTQHQLWN